MTRADFENGGCCGTQTASLASTGLDRNVPGAITDVEEYDGTSWTAGGAVPSATLYTSSVGNSSSAIQMGGTQSPTAATLSYNGTSWTAESDLVEGVSNGSGIGTSVPSAFMVGGYNGSTVVSTTQRYNGTSFSTDASLASAISQTGRSIDIVSGGEDAGAAFSAATQEYTSEIQTATASTLTTS